MTLIRIALSAWIFGIETIFVSEGTDLEMMGYTPDLLGRLGKRTSLPHVLLLTLLIGLLIARRVLQFTLGSVLETFAYWIIPADCCRKDPHQRSQNSHESCKPPFTGTFATIIKPIHLGWGRTAAQAITHQVPERQMALRGWCHVCSKTLMIAPCIDPHCTEWHHRRKMWLSDGIVQNLPHEKGSFAKTWEVIRVHSLHSYRIQFNERYIHVLHLRNEERFEDDEEEGNGKKKK
jgi:hypothetical protein